MRKEDKQTQYVFKSEDAQALYDYLKQLDTKICKIENKVNIIDGGLSTMEKNLFLN